MTSINRTTKHCTWVLTPATRGVDAVYCGEPVSYTMPLDEDGSRVRSYDHLCAMHQHKQRQQRQAIREGIANGTLDPNDYDAYDV